MAVRFKVIVLQYHKIIESDVYNILAIKKKR